MFIQCSDCKYKYLVNSADLKPNGRMVKCANCNHSWFQELIKGEDLINPSVSKSEINEIKISADIEKNDKKNIYNKQIANLPSTIVKNQKVSVINSFLVIFFLVFIVFIFWILKSFGTNIFILINFYVNEFFFNLKLIVDDLAKITHQIFN